MSKPGLRLDVLTIFPQAVESYCAESIVGRARREGVLDLRLHDIRDGATDVHRSVDDAPFGGGPGMVLAPGPVFAAIEMAAVPRPLLLLSPGGRRFDQAMAAELAGLGPGGFSLLCGRYEGVDQRITEHMVDSEVSIGDYILAGGEIGALAIIEAVARLLPGTLGNEASSTDESFADGLLEYPQYTRPAEFRGWEVPPVLRSGDHSLVRRWRLSESIRRTIARRPDLIGSRGGLSPAERKVATEFSVEVPDWVRSRRPEDEAPPT